MCVLSGGGEGVAVAALSATFRGDICSHLFFLFFDHILRMHVVSKKLLTNIADTSELVSSQPKCSSFSVVMKVTNCCHSCNMYPV